MDVDSECPDVVDGQAETPFLANWIRFAKRAPAGFEDRGQTSGRSGAFGLGGSRIAVWFPRRNVTHFDPLGDMAMMFAIDISPASEDRTLSYVVLLP